MTSHATARSALSRFTFRGADPGELLRRAGLIGLVGAISLSPRILLPVVIPGRQFDVRFEDLVVLVCLSGWILTISRRPRLFLSPLFPAIVVYVTMVAFVTGIAMMTLGLQPLRAVPFFAKEVEYFIVFLLVVNLVRTREDLKFTTMALIGGAAINAAWVAVQLFTSVNTQLIPIIGLRPTQDPVLAQRLYESYGPVLIGESSPLATGGFFLLIFLLAFSYALTCRTVPARIGYLTMSGVLLTCVVFSESRVALIGGAVGLAILAGINRNQRKAVLIAGAVIFVTALLLNQAYFRASAWQGGPGAASRRERALAYEKATGVRVVWLAQEAGGATLGRLSFPRIRRGIDERLDLWEGMLSESPNLLTGSGKGSLGSLSGPSGVEAHNHFLRVLVESGLLGELAFIWVLVSVGHLCARTHGTGIMGITKGTSGAALAATVGLTAGAVAQDVFVPVILNEVWWVLIGLTAAAYRIERLEWDHQGEVSGRGRVLES